MTCYDTVLFPVRPDGLSRVREDDPRVLDRHIIDRSPGDLGYGPLKELQERCVLQLIPHLLKSHPYARGNALHKVPLLVEVLLQARACGMWVPTRHPSQGDH